VQQAGRQGYAIVKDELVDGWTSCAIALLKKGEAPYAIGITASSKAWPAERLRDIIVPRLVSIRDLLIPDHNRMPLQRSKRADRKD
jgi:DNA-binding IclR family transcriptional regulator